MTIYDVFLRTRSEVSNRGGKKEEMRDADDGVGCFHFFFLRFLNVFFVVHVSG